MRVECRLALHSDVDGIVRLFAVGDREGVADEVRLRGYMAGHLELVGAHLEGEVGALEDLEHRGELSRVGVVGWTECGTRFDAESPSGSPDFTVG